MWNKLSSNRGESLVESLCALLVATLSILMLSSALVASARANDAALRLRKNFSVEGQTLGAGYTLNLTAERPLGGVRFYETEKGYYYYGYIPEAEKP